MSLKKYYHIPKIIKIKNRNFCIIKVKKYIDIK